MIRKLRIDTNDILSSTDPMMRVDRLLRQAGFDMNKPMTRTENYRDFSLEYSQNMLPDLLSDCWSVAI
jgi:hypothetical protein